MRRYLLSVLGVLSLLIGQDTAVHDQVSNTPNSLYLIAGGAACSATGTGAATQFNEPFQITTDAAGNLYVADRSNSTIRKITPAGVITTVAGTTGLFGSTDGTGAAARFNTPFGITADAPQTPNSG